MQTSTLISVDTDPQVQAVAREFLGSDPRLTLVTEDGAAFLRRQPAQSFDLVFADAMPGKYEALEDALAVVKPGGFYIIDDMLPQPNWPEGHAEKVPALLDRLAADHRFVDRSHDLGQRRRGSRAQAMRSARDNKTRHMASRKEKIRKASSLPHLRHDCSAQG